MNIFKILSLAIIFLSSSAWAKDTTHQTDLDTLLDFVRGDYQAIIKRTNKNPKTIHSLFAGCKARLIYYGHYGAKKDYKKLINETITVCEKLIAKDPKHQEGHLLLGFIYGQKAKIFTSPAYGKKSRDVFKRAIKYYPENNLMHAALASWHAETIRQGFLARIAMGAKKGIAQKEFEKAFQKPISELAMKLEYLKFLAYSKNYAKALEVGKDIAAHKKTFQFDTVLKEFSSAIIKAVKAKKYKAVKKAIKKAAPFSK